VISTVSRRALDTRLQVHCILEGGPPVVLLGNTLLISLGEHRIVVQGGDGQRELGHGMEGGWAPVQDFLDEFGNGGARGPIPREGVDLFLCGDFAGHEEPEEAFWQWLLAAWRLGEEFLGLRDGLAPEANALLYAGRMIR